MLAFIIEHEGADKQKGPQERTLQADLRKIPTESIPQERGHIPFSFDEFPKMGLYPRDRFVGTVRDFRRYLSSMRRFLNAQTIGISTGGLGHGKTGL